MSAENIINNPPKEFTEPCFACGVSEFQLGVRHAEQRIIKMLKKEAEHHKQISESISMDEYMSESDSESERWASVVLDKFADALIKGEQKVIHTHEIQVFGAPCDCGTRHEYCGECSWVEPCEPEGEQK